MADPIPLVWSEAHRRHEPSAEIWLGVRTPAVELPARADAIRAELERAGHPVVTATAHPDAALEAVHDRALLDFLSGAWEAWAAAGLPDDPGQPEVIPYFFAHPGLLGPIAPRLPAATWARTGHFAFDTMTPIGPGTWEAARGAADAALTACDDSARRRPRRVRLLPPAGPPRDPQRVRRLLLPQQRRDRRSPAARRARRPGRGARRRRAPRQRRAGDLLRARRRGHRLGARRPGRRLVPALPRPRGRAGRGRREPQRAARAGQRRRDVGRRRARARMVGGRLRAARAGRRARRRRGGGRPGEPAARDRRTATATPATRSGRSGCRRSSSRRAATTSTRSAGSCVRRWRD